MTTQMFHHNTKYRMFLFTLQSHEVLSHSHKKREILLKLNVCKIPELAEC